ncbi:cytochrome P450 [Boletus edulis BED1]|uniref:Cytochrome P450 n=1 Tax=Boletus edulis BED1 TaxID=1328754 RepID=A0AAD4GLC9_BOLED|nr:cytochrome P450 [Boletus edulis BED1]
MMLVTLLALAAVLLAISGARKLRRSRSQAHPGRPPLPPGPAPLPFLGNVLGVNKDAPHLTYTAWSKTYGDIVYTRMLGQDIILLNSERVAVELLEKRSQKYSDRPVFAAADLFDYEWPSSSARYGPRFRLHRRLLHQVFHAKAALDYRERQLQRAYELLTRLLDDPARYAAHFTTFSASVVMGVTYGYDMKGGDTFVTSMQRASDIFLGIATPEIFALCIAFPFVKALPAWFPGMGWKSKAAECRRLVSDGLNTPYAWVKRRVEQGDTTPSMVADAIIRHRLEDDSNNPELVQAIKESAGTLYAASVETTHATLLVFVYLMMNHPEVQCRAQAEIDRVVAHQRLPDFEDRASLPYIDAVLRETMRSHPVTPIGVPHATTEDDVYEGCYIPQGATIIPNICRAMSHDEEKYPNPEVFMPERFLREDGTLNEDKVPYMFGFGRRLCPGRHVGDASLWSAMVCILTLFRIEKTEGSDNVKWSTGLARHPLPFPCRFIPRDEEMDCQKLASLIYASRIAL